MRGLDRPHPLRLDDGAELTIRYVIGADGAHSTVRDLIDVGFVGDGYGMPMLLADVRLPAGAEPPISQAGAEGAVVVLRGRRPCPRQPLGDRHAEGEPGVTAAEPGRGFDPAAFETCRHR